MHANGTFVQKLSLSHLVYMPRKAFFSFHYVPDNWRASQVRSMGLIEGDEPVSDNDWETVTKGGDTAIEKWIAGQMSGKSCAIVLIGSGTAGRKWISYEISKAWNDSLGVVGIHVHNLKDSDGLQSYKGSNPFDHVTFTKSGAKLSTVAKVYDPPFTSSKDVYAHIKSNLSSWVEEAIKIRQKN
jgi:Thoeris protein ThsB, TIR-like domain